MTRCPGFPRNITLSLVGASGTTIALLKSIIDVLNRDFHNGPSTWNMQGVSGHGTFSVFPQDHDIRSISCYRNMCALLKKHPPAVASHAGPNPKMANGVCQVRKMGKARGGKGLGRGRGKLHRGRGKKFFPETPAQRKKMRG